MTPTIDRGGAEPFDEAPARLIIHRDHIAANWRTLSRLSGGAAVAGVVKADAYGLGLADIAHTLVRAGCRSFYVATADEGVRLRAALAGAGGPGDERIFVLAGFWPGLAGLYLAHRLIPAIASVEQLAAFLPVMAAGDGAGFALQVDTGMARLGLSEEEALRLAFDPRFSARFRPVQVLSHLACADDQTDPLNRAQLESFRHVAAAFKGVESSLAASAGIFLGPDYHFSLVRPGIALYGGQAVGGHANPMLPGVTAEARILQIRTVKAGASIGYGATHRMAADGRIAIAAAGYGDGWQRSLSGSGVPLRRLGGSGGHGVVKGFKVPLVGRVTMDLSAFDLSAIPDGVVASGDYIELFGNYAGLDEAAAAAGTIGYELLTALSRRAVRRYRG